MRSLHTTGVPAEANVPHRLLILGVAQRRAPDHTRVLRLAPLPCFLLPLEAAAAVGLQRPRAGIPAAVPSGSVNKCKPRDTGHSARQVVPESSARSLLLFMYGLHELQKVRRCGWQQAKQPAAVERHLPDSAAGTLIMS